MRTAAVFVAGLTIGGVIQVALAQNQGVVAMNHVGINVPNINEAIAYYTQKMGYREAFRATNAQGQPTLVYLHVDMAVTCQVGHTLPVLTIVSRLLSRFSVFVHRSFRRHDVLATVDAADIRGLATARLLCVAELPHSSHGHRSRS